MIRVSGREHNSFIESACFEGGELSCLSCHSMHSSDPDDQLAERALGRQGDDACLQCHAAYADDIEAHTFHDPESSGSRCVNCHMPHTVYGLLKNIRSHWIDSPNATTTVETGRPNACELCHLDRSLGWVASRLESRYGQPQPKLSSDEQSVASGIRWLLTGNAQQRALIAWHMGWSGAEGAFGVGGWSDGIDSKAAPDSSAAGGLGGARDPDWRAFFLARLLDDPYPAVRYLADRALRRLPEGNGIEYDFLAPSAARSAAAERVMSATRPRAIHSESPKSTDGASTFAARVLLRTPDGELDRERFDRLAAMRDDQPMDLRE
jgi:predicted CXXCH cytochrome family protein